MPDAVWPVSLPPPLLTGYSITDELPLIRTSMESGPDRVTRISTQFNTNVSFSMTLTRDQAATFRNFFEVECNAGANWFDISLDTGNTLATHRSRFTASPRYALNPPFYSVSFSIETDERVITLP